jgi:hypothetical protein
MGQECDGEELVQPVPTMPTILSPEIASAPLRGASSRPVLAERRVWWFAALEAATASITAGWLLHRRLLPAAVNGAALVGFAIAWLITGQRAGPGAGKAR